MSKGPSKYKAVKNPCKICYQTVKPKNGLQCMGACEAWVHYNCLNYTPGKIYDIKKGLIEVTCPCPDCDDGKPKEYGTDALYSGENVTYGNDEYKPPHMRNIGPIPVAPSSSITECIKYGSEYMPVPVQQVQGEVLHTNQWAPTGQLKTIGNHNNCSPKNQVEVVGPNPGNLMEQMMGTIGELSQRLQGLMMQIQRSPGYSPSSSASPHLSSYAQSAHSQERNPAVVEWPRHEPNCNGMSNSSTTSTIPDMDFVMSQQGPTMVNQFRVYDHQSKQPTNAYVVNRKCCYYPKEHRIYRH